MRNIVTIWESKFYIENLNSWENIRINEDIRAIQTRQAAAVRAENLAVADKPMTILWAVLDELNMVDGTIRSISTRQLINDTIRHIF
jgi:hypothetical protein